MPAKTEKAEKKVTPHLTCMITGKTRPTNLEYLENKAAGPAGSIDAFRKNYVCKEALSALRKNPTQEGVAEIRKELGESFPEGMSVPEISKNMITRILTYNGKQKAAAPVVTESKPKAKARKSRTTKTDADNSSESQEGAEVAEVEQTEEVNA
jgi:hypothetical protein